MSVCLTFWMIENHSPRGWNTSVESVASKPSSCGLPLRRTNEVLLSIWVFIRHKKLLVCLVLAPSFNAVFGISGHLSLTISMQRPLPRLMVEATGHPYRKVAGEHSQGLC
mmetsp:Transcript_31562/g.71005  ORF Transcript_31562/g.71005 Transcript_31562/m.71005 type:complete len:110 (+) Transcript_31562:530-859(+)